MTSTAAAPTTVGTVFAQSYGYDETHVAFYEITEISKSGKSGKARRIRSTVDGSTGHADSVIPATGDDRFDVRQGCARCSNHHEGEQGWDGHEFTVDYTWQARYDRVTVDRGGHASRWNGRPMYATGAGFGR